MHPRHPAFLVQLRKTLILSAENENDCRTVLPLKPQPDPPSNDSRKRRSGNYKMSGSALLGNTGLVPIDDVDQFPWILAKLNLQLALFVDR